MADFFNKLKERIETVVTPPTATPGSSPAKSSDEKSSTDSPTRAPVWQFVPT